MLGKYASYTETSRGYYGLGADPVPSTGASIFSSILDLYGGITQQQIATDAADAAMEHELAMQELATQQILAASNKPAMKTSTIIALVLGIGGVLLLGGSLVAKKRKKRR